MREKGTFTSIKNAFAICLSNSALSIFESQGLVAAVIEEVQLNAQNFTFSSTESCYPVSKDSSPREEWDSLEKVFNCTVVK